MYGFPAPKLLRTFKANDWVCGNCYFINFEQNRTCVSCNIGARFARMGVTPGSSESMSVADALNPSRGYH